MGRTIGRHWPRSSPRGDVTAMCDYCGSFWPRSRLHREYGGLLRCPDEGKGRDKALLSVLNAQRIKALQDVQQTRGEGRVPSAGSEYDTSPQEILGSDLVGWWNMDGAAVAGSPEEYRSMENYLNSSTLQIYIQLAGYTAAEAAAAVAGTLTTVRGDESGITTLRNLAKRYSDGGVDSTNLERDNFLDLHSYQLYSPKYDEDNDCAYFDWSTGKAHRRLYTVKGDKIMSAGTNPSVWVVFKPAGNAITSSSNPVDHATNYSNVFSLRRDYLAPRTGGDGNDEVFSIMWGGTHFANGSGVNAFWQANANYTTAGQKRVYAGSSMNGDNSRRVWSARMETDQLVLKISDTEFTTSITTGDSLKYDMHFMTLGDGCNGEISEVILSSGTPTAAQISSIESYLKKAHSDIVETL